MRVNCRTSHKKTSVIQTWLEPHGINLLGSFILYEIQLIKHRKTATEIEIKEEKEKIAKEKKVIPDPIEDRKFQE